MATGVLVLCLGKATRLIPYIEESGGSAAKEYEARIRFGFETTTDDAEGEPRGEASPVDLLTRDAVARALRSLVGEIEQIPPAYSAKKVAGERAYALARRGEEAVLKPVRVAVQTAELLEMEVAFATVRFACSRGTYIRALARDLGRALGVGAHLCALRRTRSGAARLARAVPLDQLNPLSIAENLVPLASILDVWPRISVNEGAAANLRLGRSIDSPAGVADPVSRVRVCDRAGNLVALAHAERSRLRPFCVFHGDDRVVSSAVPNEDKSRCKNNKAGSEEH
jgi:tRNA pseudouridine55 synthase